jgi:hypothetical protein
MHGDSVGEFNVYVNDTINGQTLKNKIKGEQGFEWKKLSLSVSYQNEFRVILEGIVSVTFLNYVKI